MTAKIVSEYRLLTNTEEGKYDRRCPITVMEVEKMSLVDYRYGIKFNN